MMGLTENCYKVITDSGGYQKEAYFAGKQAIVIMPDTSWRELTELGLNVLADENSIYKNVKSPQKGDVQRVFMGDGKHRGKSFPY